jgi:hypothetical protein
MLNAIADVSLLVHHLLLPVTMAPFLTIFFNKIMILISFDPIPVDDELDKFFGEQEALSPAFEALGYESPFLLYNNGSTTLIIILFPVSAMLQYLVSKTGENWFARNASHRIASYTRPNFYALIYTTQLLNTMMIMINLDHILERGLF